jgi:YD repeat-containing protein
MQAKKLHNCQSGLVYLPIELTKRSKNLLMKSNSIKLSLSLVLLFSSFWLFIGCHPVNDEPAGADYRIIEMKYYEGGVQTAGAYYSYGGEKLSQITSYSDDYQDTASSVFEYPDENSIVWSELTPLVKVECVFQDGKMTQSQRAQFTNNSWEIMEKYTYQYTGGNLTEEIWEGTIYGEYRPFEKFTYEYEGNKVLQAFNYYYDQYHSTWLKMGKDEAFYDGNLISKVKHYSYADSSYVEYYYTDLQYDGSLLTGSFEYVSSTNELMVSNTFTYDEKGNMVSRESTDGPAGDRIECFYEEGKGNLHQIQKPGGGIKFYSGFPMPAK